MAALNWSRCSALSIASALAPIISTPKRSSTPWRTRSIETFRPVWPPNVGRSASGRSTLDDLGSHLPHKRLDVRAIRQVGVRHDRGGVRIDQHHLVALFAQRLAGLGAGIIELAGLTDDDRTRSNDHDFVQVVATRHGDGAFFSGESARNRPDDAAGEKKTAADKPLQANTWCADPTRPVARLSRVGQHHHEPS